MRTLFRWSFRYVKGNPTKTVLESLFWFGTCFFAALLMLFLFSEQNYLSALFARYPATALLVYTSREEPEIDPQYVEEACRNPHVRAWNLQGVEAGECEGAAVSIYADTETALNPVFLYGSRSCYGDLPGEGLQGAAVSSSFAEKAGLDLSDTCMLSLGDGRERPVVITGIWKDGDDEADAENAVYVDWATFEALGGKNDAPQPTLFLDDPYAVGEILEQINRAFPEDCGYRFSVSTDYNTGQFYKSVQVSRSFIHLSACVFFGFIVLISVLMEVERRKQYEESSRILRLLGEHGGNIRRRFLLQETMLFLPAALLALLCAAPFRRPLGDYWIRIATKTFTEGSSVESFAGQRAFLESAGGGSPWARFGIIAGSFCLLFLFSALVSGLLYRFHRKRNPSGRRSI